MRGTKQVKIWSNKGPYDNYIFPGPTHIQKVIWIHSGPNEITTASKEDSRPKPSSNSTAQVDWITEPAMGFPVTTTILTYISREGNMTYLFYSIVLRETNLFAHIWKRTMHFFMLDR